MNDDVLRCEVAVTRDWDMDACNKPAVGRLRPLDWEVEEFGPCEPYPACRFHLYRLGGNGRAVELTRTGPACATYTGGES